MAKKEVVEAAVKATKEIVKAKRELGITELLMKVIFARAGKLK